MFRDDTHKVASIYTQNLISFSRQFRHHSFLLYHNEIPVVQEQVVIIVFR